MLTFIANPHDPVRIGDYLRTGLRNHSWSEFRAAVAFVRLSGTQHICPDLSTFSQQGKVSISVGVDHGGTTVEGLTSLLSAVGVREKLWVFKNPGSTFHPKLYVFKNAEAADVVIGSGNMTAGGLYTNYEGAVRLQLVLSEPGDARILKDIENVLNYWSSPKPGLCMAVDTSLIELLKKSGDLPTEATVHANLKAATNRRASGAISESPFVGEDVPPAPMVATAGLKSSPRATHPAVAAKASGIAIVCRVIVRGRTIGGGPLLRAVRNLNVSGENVAECMTKARQLSDAGIYEQIVRERKFVEVTTRTVYPPVGLLVDGGLSKGFSLAPNGIAFRKQ